MERKDKQFGVIMDVKTYFDNVKFILIDKHEDKRGWFLQSHDSKITELLDTKFVQENISFSYYGVVRGLHYQWDQPMGKLVQCINGKIIDIIVDIRKESSTLGKFELFELDKPEKMLWVPSGFAHGFVSLSNNTIVKYMCNNLYNKNGENAIFVFDQELKINEKLKLNLDKVNLSDKDTNAQSFSDYLKNPKF